MGKLSDTMAPHAARQRCLAHAQPPAVTVNQGVAANNLPKYVEISQDALLAAAVVQGKCLAMEVCAARTMI